MNGRPPLVVLSPHPDDAALAVGGLLARHTRHGGHAVIVTVFAGSPAHDGTPVTRGLYPHHPHPVEIARIRRREDHAAGHQLRAEVVHLPHLDAMYRTTPDGTPTYTDLEQIFNAADIDIEPAADHLARQLVANELFAANADVLAPLGIGGHVDHRIVRQAAEKAHDLYGTPAFRLSYYEDQPYTARRRQHDWQHLIPGHCVPAVHRLTSAERRQKITAIECHTSQLPLLWPNGQSFEDELLEYAIAVGGSGPAERTWAAAST